MYSDKKNILQLVALLKEYGISNVVLCPGSRNTPIIHTLANHPFFKCHAVTDERSAGFFAMGLALQSNKPAVICCTSGTALLNIHPAVAEAFYQQIPLIVISADRPAAWIGQMDGQTLPQPNAFGSLVKKSVNLPEIRTGEDEWYCNRLVNETLLELDHHGKGPVHINVPISEPLFQFTTETLPNVRIITRYQGLDIYTGKQNELIERWHKYNKRMIVAGQMTSGFPLNKETGEILQQHFILLAEHIGNPMPSLLPIKNFDTLLHTLPEEQAAELVPDLLITYGGNVVSKRLRKFLRSNPPKEHWHVSADGDVVDLYGSLTAVIEMNPIDFLEKMTSLLLCADLACHTSAPYLQAWKNRSQRTPEPQLPYSEISAIGMLIKTLPENTILHLANSSTVRYAQLFPISNTIEVFCNRGTSGIEGSLSTAVGYASLSNKLNVVVIGDLSFFYDMNALWNGHIQHNLRILLLNNGGGGIFQTLPGLDMTEQTRNFVTAPHTTSAKGWVTERGFQYMSVSNEEELIDALRLFTQPESTNKPMLLEVFTDKAEDMRFQKEYYKQ